MPIYQEKINASYPLIAGVLIWSLAVGLIPGIILSGAWWFAAAYIALTAAVVASFFQMKVELFEDKLTIRFGIIYRKTIEVDKIQNCSTHKMKHPVKNYGGWGIRKGKDGTFAITQAFINEAIKLETAEQTYIISSRKPKSFRDAIQALKK